MILTGSPERPVRIDCEDMHLSGDQMEVFNGHQVVATGNVLFESATNRICGRSARVRHEDAHRHVLQRRGNGQHGRARRPQPVRDAGAGRHVPRRGDPQARARYLQDRARRLHHLRAADAAVGDGGGLRDAEGGRPRADHQRHPARQGRAGDVPAGLLLSRSRRTTAPPDSCSRSTAPRPSAGSRSATRSSGRSAAARTRR